MKKEKAFSLVELSIVLVILGLLVGGVLTGKSLIRAAELRAITTEKDKYTAAVFSFRDKYFQMPGDINNAYQIWGTACGTDTTAASTGCNGDGDGLIEVGNSLGEQIKAWEHLSRAGLIEGSYDGTGTVDVGGNTELTLTNSPKSRFPKGAWTLASEVVEAANNGMGGFTSGIHLTFGEISASGGVAMIQRGTSLTRGDALGIDRKTDDAKADTGKVRGNSDSDCTDIYGKGDYGTNATMGGDADYAGDCTMTFILVDP